MAKEWRWIVDQLEQLQATWGELSKLVTPAEREKADRYEKAMDEIFAEVEILNTNAKGLVKASTDELELDEINDYANEIAMGRQRMLGYLQEAKNWASLVGLQVMTRLAMPTVPAVPKLTPRQAAVHAREVARKVAAGIPVMK